MTATLPAAPPRAPIHVGTDMHDLDELVRRAIDHADEVGTIAATRELHRRGQATTATLLADALAAVLDADPPVCEGCIP